MLSDDAVCDHKRTCRFTSPESHRPESESGAEGRGHPAGERGRPSRERNQYLSAPPRYTAPGRSATLTDGHAACAGIPPAHVNASSKAAADESPHRSWCPSFARVTVGAMPETDAVMDSLDYARLSFRRDLSVKPALWRDWRATADVLGDVSALVLVSGTPGADPCVECGELRLLARIDSPCETCGAPARPNAADLVWQIAAAAPSRLSLAVQRVREADMAEPEVHVTLVYSPQFGARSWLERLTDRRKEMPADDLYRLLIQVVAKSLAQREVVVEVKSRNDDPIPREVTTALDLELVSVYD